MKIQKYHLCSSTAYMFFKCDIQSIWIFINSSKKNILVINMVWWAIIVCVTFNNVRFRKLHCWLTVHMHMVFFLFIKLPFINTNLYVKCYMLQSQIDLISEGQTSEISFEYLLLNRDKQINHNVMFLSYDFYSLQ